MRSVISRAGTWWGAAALVCCLPGPSVAEDELPSFSNTYVEPDIVFVLDSSWAMQSPTEDDPSGASRATLTKQAISSVVGQYQTQVNWGLVTTSGTTGCIWPNNYCRGGSVKVKPGTSNIVNTMNTALTSWANTVNNTSSTTALKSRKDWEKTFYDGTVNSTPNDVLDLWVYRIKNDSSRSCRKRAVIFVTAGGVNPYAPADIDCLDGTPDNVQTIYESINSYISPYSVTDDIETYVLGFNLDYAEDRLNDIATKGGTEKPRSAASLEEYKALVEDILSRIISGEYSASDPVLSSDYEHLYQTYLRVYDPGPDPDNHAWEGHLTDWLLDSDGNVVSDGVGAEGYAWDAQAWLSVTVSYDSRTIYTSYDDGAGNEFALTTFSDSDVSHISTLLNVNSSDVNCNGAVGAIGSSDESLDAQALIHLVRGDRNQQYSPCSGEYRESYKLLDIYRSTPRYVGPPEAPYTDPDYVDVFQPAQSLRDDLLIVSGNDGMIHAFQAAYNTGTSKERSLTGKEKWAYIPQHILPRLKELWESYHATLANATASVADVKVGTPADPDALEWKTMAVVGDGFEGDETLCGEAIADVDSVDGQRKLWNCGFYTALDVSVMTSATSFSVEPLWEFYGDGDLLQTAAPPTFARIRMNKAPAVRDVLFLAGKGVINTPADPDAVKCNSPVYVVNPGDADDVYAKFELPYRQSSSACDATVHHGIQGQALAVDTDNDLLADRAYVGDMEGVVWRLNLGDKNPDNWTADDIFYPTDFGLSHTYSGEALPVTYSVAATYTVEGDILLYVGTGDPTTVDEFGTSPMPRGHLYVLRDSVSTGTVELYTGFEDPYGHEGYWELRDGEVLAGDPKIAGGTVYFTTYVMPTSACGPGEGYLYAVNFLTGAASQDLNGDGSVTSSDVYVDLGAGVPSGVVIGNGQVYVTLNDGSIDSDSPTNAGIKAKTGVVVSQPIMPYGWAEVTGR